MVLVVTLRTSCAVLITGGRCDTRHRDTHLHWSGPTRGTAIFKPDVRQEHPQARPSCQRRHWPVAAQRRLVAVDIVFFVIAAAAPLVGMTGALPAAIVLGNGAASAMRPW